MLTEQYQATRIGARLKAARERSGLTQKELAARLGFENRQTLASIEAGERKLSAPELIAVVQLLGVDLDYFTDAFRLVGEGRFSFRARPRTSAAILDQFEEKAGRWIATYRELGTQQGEAPDLLQLKLALSERSQFEEANAAAESLAERWSLGAVPALRLRAAMEQHLRALILFVDAPDAISGAASQLPGLNTVLVNRKERATRRNFDMAHELFHLLTWDAMPPERIEAIEVPTSGKGHRREQLAENFAAALLMPSADLRARWGERGDVNVNTWLVGTAAHYQVSAVALKWRLVNLGVLSKGDLFDVDPQLAAASLPDDSSLVRRFSEPFVRRVATALDAGRLSVKRAASLLSLTPMGLAELLGEYGIEPQFEA